MNILDTLWDAHDEGYASFVLSLTPGLKKETVIGVRIPILRRLAKKLSQSPEKVEFLSSLPHAYYEENLIHGILLSQEKDFKTCLKEVLTFLPYLDNWAVTDIISPKVFSKHQTELLPYIKKWIRSKETYTSRFGIEMLMKYELDEGLNPKVLQLPLLAGNSTYYVKMMLAWFYATALAKHWEEAFPYLTDQKLDAWTHRKTVQKGLESYRLSDEQKEKLKKLR